MNKYLKIKLYEKGGDIIKTPNLSPIDKDKYGLNLIKEDSKEGLEFINTDVRYQLLMDDIEGIRFSEDISDLVEEDRGIAFEMENAYVTVKDGGSRKAKRQLSALKHLLQPYVSKEN